MVLHKMIAVHILRLSVMNIIRRRFLYTMNDPGWPAAFEVPHEVCVASAFFYDHTITIIVGLISVLLSCSHVNCLLQSQRRWPSFTILYLAVAASVYFSDWQCSRLQHWNSHIRKETTCNLQSSCDLSCQQPPSPTENDQCDVYIRHQENRHPLRKSVNQCLRSADTDLKKKLRMALHRAKSTCDC